MKVYYTFITINILNIKGHFGMLFIWNLHMKAESARWVTNLYISVQMVLIIAAVVHNGECHVVVLTGVGVNLSLTISSVCYLTPNRSCHAFMKGEVNAKWCFLFVISEIKINIKLVCFWNKFQINCKMYLILWWLGKYKYCLTGCLLVVVIEIYKYKF